MAGGLSFLRHHQRVATYSIIAGAFAGGGPFWLLSALVAGARWPVRIALGIGVVLSATAFRRPGAWAIGMALGILASWAALARLIGSDWRIVPYVLASFAGYYLAAVAVIGGAYLVGSRQPQRR